MVVVAAVCGGERRSLPDGEWKKVKERMLFRKRVCYSFCSIWLESMVPFSENEDRREFAIVARTRMVRARNKGVSCDSVRNRIKNGRSCDVVIQKENGGG